MNQRMFLPSYSTNQVYHNWYNSKSNISRDFMILKIKRTSHLDMLQMLLIWEMFKKTTSMTKHYDVTVNCFISFQDCQFFNHKCKIRRETATRAKT